MTKEETLFAHHLKDLSDRAWQRGIPFFSDFLDLNEQNIALTSVQTLGLKNMILYGGYKGAERQLAVFLPDAPSSYSDEEWQALCPLTCVLIHPRNPKFSDPLSHRDFLGSLMNLGISRSLLGDLLIEDNSARVLCRTSAADLICREVLSVRHTSVDCEIVDLPGDDYMPNTERIQGSLASERLDCIVGLAFRLSRSEAANLIHGGKVYVNGRQLLSVSDRLMPGDRVSVRGSGKFIYQGLQGNTRKGRLLAALDLFI